MVVTNEETEVRTSTEGAQTFIDWYYKAINDRKPVAPFYVDSNARYTAAGTRADISINGAALAGGPPEFEKLLERQNGSGGHVKYEVDGYDAQVLNPAFRVGCPDHLLAANETARGRGALAAQAAQAHKVSLMVQVTGFVQYGPGKEAPKSAFAEVFVLAPNWDAMGPKAPRGLRGWLIMSQNFRAL